MKNIIIVLMLLQSASQVMGQKHHDKVDEPPVPIKIQWVDHIKGDFSFTEKWSYPIGVEAKADGKAGCADGGFCPQRCYGMMDSNYMVMKDSAEIFYHLLDTMHEFYSIECEAWCYEWLGTDFISVVKLKNGSIHCETRCGVATHCSFQLDFFKDTCYSSVVLNSIIADGSAVYYCTKEYIKIDKNLWQKGIMKAEFSFNYKHDENPKMPMFWKGKIYSSIK